MQLICTLTNLCRYTTIGVAMMGHEAKGKTWPDVFTRITPEMKEWIMSIATGAQTSDCKCGCSCVGDCAKLDCKKKCKPMK